MPGQQLVEELQLLLGEATGAHLQGHLPAPEEMVRLSQALAQPLHCLGPIAAWGDLQGDAIPPTSDAHQGLRGFQALGRSGRGFHVRLGIGWTVRHGYLLG